MQIIITLFVQSVNNRRNQLGNREPEMARPVIQMTSCNSSVSSSLLLLLYSGDTWTSPPWRCVAISTISRQAKISVFIWSSNADVIEPLPQNRIIIPSECDRSTLSRKPVPTSAGRSSNRVGGRCRRGDDYYYTLLCWPRRPFLSQLFSPLSAHSPTHPPHKHTHTHSLVLSLSIFVWFANRIPYRDRWRHRVYRNNI